MVISSFPQIYGPGCERQASLWLPGQFGTDVECRYLTVELHIQEDTEAIYNRLKYPARSDLLIWGIEFVEGTGASYLCVAGPVLEAELRRASEGLVLVPLVRVPAPLLRHSAPCTLAVLLLLLAALTLASFPLLATAALLSSLTFALAL